MTDRRHRGFLCIRREALHNDGADAPAGTETGSQVEPALTYKVQRVSCPSCGRPLFEIEQVEPENAGFTILTKCKAGGCHRFCRVKMNRGELSVTLTDK